MDRAGHEEALPVERRDIGCRGIAPVCYARAPQQVDWIPDAVLGDETIQQRRWNHRNSACESALDAGDDRVSFYRQVCSVALWDSNLFNLLDEWSQSLWVSNNNWNILVHFMRQYLAKPADSAADHEDGTKNRNPHAGYKSGDKAEWRRRPTQ